MEINTKIIGTPVYFDPSIITDVAVFLGKSYEEIEESSNKIFSVDHLSYQLLERLSDKLDSGYTKHTIYNIVYFCNGDNIYADGSALYYDDIRTYSLLLSQTKYEFEIAAVSGEYKAAKDTLRQIREISDSIQLQHRDLMHLMKKDFVYTPFNFAELEKYCRKYKIGYELYNIPRKDKAVFGLIFSKVKVGNDIEGYVNYKKIVLRFNLNFELKSSVYYFNNWYFENIGITFCVHPHIYDYICYGNRKSDYEVYVNMRNYAFLIDLINETVRSYCADSPFVSVTDLQKKLRIIHNALPKGYSKKVSRMDICPRCNGYIFEGICSNPLCSEPALPVEEVLLSREEVQRD